MRWSLNANVMMIVHDLVFWSLNANVVMIVYGLVLWSLTASVMMIIGDSWSEREVVSSELVSKWKTYNLLLG